MLFKTDMCGARNVRVEMLKCGPFIGLMSTRAAFHEMLAPNIQNLDINIITAQDI